MICTKCQQDFPETHEYFPSAPRKSNRLSSWCRSCHRVNVRQWFAEHQEANKETCRLYYHANKESSKISKADAYQQNKESILLKNKVYRDTHKEALKTQYHLYYENHKETRKAYVKEWRTRNPERHSAHNQTRRARKANAPINDFTAEQWAAMKEHYGHRCVYCGKKSQRLTQDHITPISQGGSHTLANIVPSCKTCNSRKSAGPPLVPVQPLLL